MELFVKLNGPLKLKIVAWFVIALSIGWTKRFKLQLFCEPLDFGINRFYLILRRTQKHVNFLLNTIKNSRRINVKKHTYRMSERYREMKNKNPLVSFDTCCCRLFRWMSALYDFYMSHTNDDEAHMRTISAFNNISVIGDRVCLFFFFLSHFILVCFWSCVPQQHQQPSIYSPVFRRYVCVGVYTYVRVYIHNVDCFIYFFFVFGWSAIIGIIITFFFLHENVISFTWFFCRFLMWTRWALTNTVNANDLKRISIYLHIDFKKWNFFLIW